MRLSSATQLKDWIKNTSKQTGTPANVLLQTYMMERLLERISLSSYRYVSKRTVCVVYS